MINTKTPIKILMLNYEFPPIGGGGGNANLCILNEFAKNNNLEIQLLTSNSKQTYEIQQFSENILIHRVGIHKKDLQKWTKAEVISWLFRSKKYYNKIIKELNPDIIHCFFGFPTGWLCRKSKQPCIISLRGSDVPGSNPKFALDYKILAPVFKKIWKHANILTTVSHGLQKRANNFMPNLDIKIIANGINTEKFHPTEQINTKELKLITVGRLSPSKRFDLLLKSISQLKNKHLKLTIVGGGSEEKYLKTLTAKLNLESIVSFTGRITTENMPQTYNNHNIYISTSSSEGMSNAMLEAMASGLAVISLEVEGTQELLDDNAILLKNDSSPKEIALAIDSLQNQPGKIIQMAKASRKKALQFTWTDTAEKYHQLYYSLIGKN